MKTLSEYRFSTFTPTYVRTYRKKIRFGLSLFLTDDSFDSEILQSKIRNLERATLFSLLSRRLICILVQYDISTFGIQYYSVHYQKD
jgi:hypothetical protein